MFSWENTQKSFWIPTREPTDEIKLCIICAFVVRLYILTMKQKFLRIFFSFFHFLVFHSEMEINFSQKWYNQANRNVSRMLQMGFSCSFFPFFRNFFYSTRKFKRIKKIVLTWPFSNFLAQICSLVLLPVWNGNGALPEAVPELASDHLEVSHATGASHLSADGLLRPVVMTHSSSGESTRWANLLLDVEGDPTAPPAEGVGVVAALAKQAGTLSHCFRCWRGTGKGVPSFLPKESYKLQCLLLASSSSIEYCNNLAFRARSKVTKNDVS